MPDSEAQTRTPKIMRFPQPHDSDGRPCPPTDHPRSQPPSPTSRRPTRANSSKPKPAPARLPCRHSRSQGAFRPPPPTGCHPRLGGGCGAGRCPVVCRHRRVGRRCAPAGPRGARRPPRRARPLGSAGRDHHPPHPGPAGRRVAVDGKTLRGSGHHGHGQVHLPAAMDHATGAVLAQTEVDHTTNEITRFQPLLEQLDLTDTVVTTDALHTQREHAEFLVTRKHADWLLVVKANQCAARRLAVSPTGVGRDSKRYLWVRWLTWIRKEKGTRACQRTGGQAQASGMTRRVTRVIWRKLNCLNPNLQRMPLCIHRKDA